MYKDCRSRSEQDYGLRWSQSSSSAFVHAHAIDNYYGETKWLLFVYAQYRTILNYNSDIGTLCLKRHYCSALPEKGMPSLGQPGSISHRSLATRRRLDLAYKEQLPGPKFMGL